MCGWGGGGISEIENWESKIMIFSFFQNCPYDVPRVSGHVLVVGNHSYSALAVIRNVMEIQLEVTTLSLAYVGLFRTL